MDKIKQFEKDVENNIENLSKNHSLDKLTMDWMLEAGLSGNYVYNFTSLGRPIIQFPQDMVALQEIVWRVKPDLIIETGIAHGGSIIHSASLMALLEVCESIKHDKQINLKKPSRKVIGIDIDIRQHNREKIESHPLFPFIEMIEGSSIDSRVVSEVQRYAEDHHVVLVCLDSNHTHSHVLQELIHYAPMVTKQSYCIVYDTLIESIPDDIYKDRPWGKGNNPKTAIDEYFNLLKTKTCVGLDDKPLQFKVDKQIETKLQITAAPSGYLQRI